MSVIYHERPGVYSDYDTSSTMASLAKASVVAVAGESELEKKIYTITSLASGSALFGEDSSMTKLLTLLYRNGAGTVMIYPVEETTTEEYEEAFAALMGERSANYLICDSETLEVHTALRDAVLQSSEQRGECIGIVGIKGDAKSTELINWAEELNSERMVLVGPGCYLSGEETSSGIWGAAALAGLLAAQTDPALPLNGAVLAGFNSVSARYEDTDMDALIQGGVTVLEANAGQVSVIRGITTRTKTSGQSDATWRELNTILIADYVIPKIRSALKSRFMRTKNTASTRSAIRSQVIVELEDLITREIIESYDEVSVSADTSDPTICLVEFGFQVVHGLSRIYLTAHITV